MLTVHVLPVTHELIAHREEAIAADTSLIEEVMVIIDRGLVTAIFTPPKGIGYRFESDDSWIRDAIASAYARGLEAGAEPVRIVAPVGWVFWSELMSGDIATSGGKEGWVAISNDPTFKFSNVGVNARRFAHEDLAGDVARYSDIRFTFDPNQRRMWPFYRVARRGLTGEQILTLLDAVADAPADESVQATIDRVLPVGA